MEPRARLAAVLATCVAGVTAGALWGTTATSCAGGSEGPSSPASAPSATDERCAVALDPPSFAPEPPPAMGAPPRSRIAVELSVDHAALERILDERIPKGLGSAERRPIGAPGEVTYSVSRGAPKVALVDEALEVKVPIHAAVEVCKPFGRLCPVYGTCQPNLVATTRVPLRLDERYGIEPAKVDVRVTRGCRIAGFDVTGEIQNAAAGARRSAERRIADAIPDLRAHLDEAMRRLARPVRVESDRCARISPLAIRQGTPRSANGALHTALEIEGTIEPADCDARFPAPTLPPLTRLEGPPKSSELVLLERIDADLTDLLAVTAPAGREVEVLDVVPHRHDEGPRLAIELKLEGAVCGTLWALTTPAVEDGALVLRDPTPATPSEPARRALEDLGLRAERIDTDDLGTRLADRLRSAIPSLSVDGIEGLRAEVDVLDSSADIVPNGDGISLRTATRGRIAIVVAAPAPR